MYAGRVLAIDYGEKRIGLALSDPMRIIASPLTTIENTPEAVSVITGIVDKEEVTEIIIGQPKKLDGTPGDLAQEIEKFVISLEQRTGKHIKPVDERFTSSIASGRILEAVPGKMKRRDKSLIDKHAAAVLLEGYLRSL